jgi:spore coat protein CotH
MRTARPSPAATFYLALRAALVGWSLFLMPGQAAAQTQNDLFDNSVLQEIRITVNPETWAQFKENILSNDYIAGDLSWRGVVVSNIGIRHRGTGSRSSVQPYLGLSFGRNVKGQQFLGLTDLRLKNSTQDPSELRERLGMLLLRRMGVPAPREAQARLYVNDEYLGLYMIIEEVDDLFMDRVFHEHSGCHYNYNWVREYYFEYLGALCARYVRTQILPRRNRSGSHR